MRLEPPSPINGASSWHVSCCACAGWRNRIGLGRDYYVRIDTNDYSVDPRAIGRVVEVTADLDRVRVRQEGRIIADHARAWARAW